MIIALVGLRDEVETEIEMLQERENIKMRTTLIEMVCAYIVPFLRFLPAF